MMDAQRWHDFFMLSGTAAATLIGLMFIAVSFAVGSTAQRSRRDLDVWVTPSLVYFLEAFLVSGALLTPIGPRLLGLLLLALLSLNLPFGVLRIRYLLQKHKEESIVSSAWAWQVLLPLVAQIVLALGAAGLFLGHTGAHAAIALAVTLLLSISVRNAWYLVVWLLEQR
jgi:hypothetical protein